VPNYGIELVRWKRINNIDPSYVLLLNCSEASWREPEICVRAILPNVALLKISFRQFKACTCGRLVFSSGDSSIGLLAISVSFANTSRKDGLFEFAERIPVIRAGTPADLLVVETWVRMHESAPYECD
jgi:hypothetical protein